MADTNNRNKSGTKWWQYLLRCIGLLLLLLIIIIGVVVGWLGPIVERYVEEHDKELVGRSLSMDNLRIKLFKGRIAVDDLALLEADDSTRFVAAEHIDIRLKLGELLNSRAYVTRAHLQSPYLHIEQQDTTFNFDDLVSYLSQRYMGEPDEEAADTASSWDVVVVDAAITEGELAYYDSSTHQRWTLSAIDIKADTLSLQDRFNTVEWAMNINRNATLGGSVSLNGHTMDYALDAALKDFRLADTYKYVVPYVNITKIDGVAAVDMSLRGNLTEVLASDIVGGISLRDVELLDSRGEELFVADGLSLAIKEMNVEKQYYHLSMLGAENYSLRMIFNEDGTTNYNNLLYDRAELSVETVSDEVEDDMYEVRERVTLTTDSDVAPLQDMTLLIDHIKLSGGQVYYADATMHEKFDYRLRNLGIECDDFNLVGVNQVTVRTNLQKQGSALLRWEGSLADFYNQSLLAMFTNVDIKDFSTYVEHYTAFPVLDGNLTFRSQNVVTNGELSGINQLGTYNFSVGKKDKSLDAEYNIPLKLGIFILTDRKDNINVDLPITGRIDAPEFSYRKLIMRAIGNLLLKIVAAPFEWMAGDKQDAFRHIDVDMLATGFDSEHYARFDKMAEELKASPDIQVRLTQRVNYERAKQRIADLNLKIAYYNSTQSDGSQRFGMLDFAHVKELKVSRSEVVEFADSQLWARGIDPTHMKIGAKSMALYGDMADEQIVRLLTYRNNIVKEYMSFQHADMPEGSFAINDVKLDDLRNYTGKDRYTVTMLLDDEEYELSMPDEAMDDTMVDYYDAFEEDTSADAEDNIPSDATFEDGEDVEDGGSADSAMNE